MYETQEVAMSRRNKKQQLYFPCLLRKNLLLLVSVTKPWKRPFDLRHTLYESDLKISCLQTVHLLRGLRPNQYCISIFDLKAKATEFLCFTSNQVEIDLQVLCFESLQMFSFDIQFPKKTQQLLQFLTARRRSLKTFRNRFLGC